jgi:hypothetical protein
MIKNLPWLSFIAFFFCVQSTLSQISPGPLSSVHSNLEGLSNCTKCHAIGNKVTNAKCLECHNEVKARVDQNKGYHSSAEIRGKGCVTCHSDHNGINFQIIRFDKDKFNHALTGYVLAGAHAKKTCKDCHKPEFITSKTIRGKKFTYLGLNTECLNCHPDYHQQTLSPTCSNCHGPDTFKPAVKFNHTMTRFQLTGMHQTVPCVKCHALTTKNGKPFQQFAGTRFSNCTPCHADVHQNKFGQNCAQCHTVESFHAVKGISNFDHSKTNFRLEGKHLAVTCTSCHKTNLTDPLKYTHCTDCHADYHHGEFTRQGIVTDCSACHNTTGYANFSFTIEQHNSGNFKLEGAHLATPCIACHKKNENWSFRQIGLRCGDCHENIHQPYLSPNYYPDKNCTGCHNESSWASVSFDHSRTKFILSAPHAKQTCRTCHFKKDDAGHETQRFSDMSSNCSDCHTDIHYRQFEENGVTACLRCHASETWKITGFDHSKTAFPLVGRHKELACSSCHKEFTENEHTFVLYKIKDTRCESCH